MRKRIGFLFSWVTEPLFIVGIGAFALGVFWPKVRGLYESRPTDVKDASISKKIETSKKPPAIVKLREEEDFPKRLKFLLDALQDIDDERAILDHLGREFLQNEDHESLTDLLRIEFRRAGGTDRSLAELATRFSSDRSEWRFFCNSIWEVLLTEDLENAFAKMESILQAVPEFSDDHFSLQMDKLAPAFGKFLSRLDTESAILHLPRRRDHQYARLFQKEYFAQLAWDDHSIASELLRSDAVPQEFMPGMVFGFARAVPLQTAEIFQQLNLSEAIRKDVEYELIENLSLIHPDKAVQWIGANRRSLVTENPYGHAFNLLYTNDAYAASSQVLQIPEGKDRDLAVISLIKRVALFDHDSAFLWVNTIADSELRAQANHILARTNENR